MPGHNKLIDGKTKWRFQYFEFIGNVFIFLYNSLNHWMKFPQIVRFCINAPSKSTRSLQGLNILVKLLSVIIMENLNMKQNECMFCRNYFSLYQKTISYKTNHQKPYHCPNRLHYTILSSNLINKMVYKM